MTPDLQTLKETLRREIAVDFLYEHDDQDYPAFELDVVPKIEQALSGLRQLDTHRLMASPETTYLFAPHALEVAQDMEALAHHLGTPEHVATGLYYLALVHDIGKLFLPPEIWETSAAKPSGLFKALRRTHSPLGAAFLSGNTGFLEPPYVPEDVLPFLKGEKPLSEIASGEITSRLPDRIDFGKILDIIKTSPFLGQTTAFLPLAVTAALRHHEKTGSDAPPDQPLWLKLLALLEDLSGNMVERPHFAAAGRKTSLSEALAHMTEEGEKTHDLGLLSLISRIKSEDQPILCPPGQPKSP